jgi:hypothetical protein
MARQFSVNRPMILKITFCKEHILKAKQYTRLVVILAFAALAFAACNRGYATPTATFKSFYEAAKSNNVDGIKKAMSKKTMDAITKAAAKENKSVDDSLKDMAKDAPSKAPETRNEKIDGDKATLEVKDDKMDKWDTVPFVKEDGLWKIALLDAMSDVMDKMDTMDPAKK